jgi:phage terminase large subunit GpA-like protein
MPEEKFSKRGIIPLGTVALTIGVDSQSDGFYFLLGCWGRKMEVWLPLTGKITGDMRGEVVWKELLSILTTSWLDREGNAYRSMISAIDVQGDYYPEVLEFVRVNGWHKVRAVRGYAAQRSLSSGRSFGILRNRYQDKSTGVTVTNIDVDIAKTQIANMLARKEPGAGYVHLPCGANGEIAGGWDIEAITELTAEYRRQTNVRGYTVSRWYKKSNRPNHRLDCFVYALAALSISRLKIDDCELQRVEARNVGKPEREKDHVQSPFGARRMIGAGDLPISGPSVGAVVGFRTANRRSSGGFGAVSGSGLSF